MPKIPLRERLDDLPLHVSSFLDKHNKKYGKEAQHLSKGVMGKLQKHAFPGNIRELENITMLAIALADREHVLTENQIQIKQICGK